MPYLLLAVDIRTFCEHLLSNRVCYNRGKHLMADGGQTRQNGLKQPSIARMTAVSQSGECVCVISRAEPSSTGRRASVHTRESSYTFHVAQCIFCDSIYMHYRYTSIPAYPALEKGISVNGAYSLVRTCIACIARRYYR